MSAKKQKRSHKNSQEAGQVKDLLSDTEEQKNGVANGTPEEKWEKFLCIEIKDKEDWLTFLTIVFAVLAIVFAVATLAIAGVKIPDISGEGQEYPHEKGSFFDTGPVCVACNELVNNKNEQGNHWLDQLTKKVNKKVKMCCAEDWDQLSVLMMSFTAAIQQNGRQTSQSFHNSLFKFSPVSAHKSLMVGDWKTGEASFFARPRPVKLNQTYNDPVTEHVRGLEIAEDGFVIPYSGVYYVYASLLFKPKTTKSFKELTYKELYGYLYRKSPSMPDHSGYYIKMCRSLPLCDDCKDDEETVFSGGVFNLLAGDKLQVRVTGPGLVEFKKESSYFGLVMLASENRASG